MKRLCKACGGNDSSRDIDEKIPSTIGNYFSWGAETHTCENCGIKFKVAFFSEMGRESTSMVKIYVGNNKLEYDR